MTPLRSSLAIGLGCLMLTLGCGGDDPSVSKPPWNLLVLVPDTLRADHLGTNGYSKPTSPNLDALAADGANFSQAITVAPRTWQSFSSILTGLYPIRHGVRYIFDRSLPKGMPTVASLLTAQGYDTASFDMVDFLRRITKHEKFDHYESVDMARTEERGQFSGQDVLSDQVFEWATRARAKPFFAFVRYAGPHWPYLYRDTQFGECGERDHSFNRGGYGMGVGRGSQGVQLTDADEYRLRIFTVDPDAAQRAHVVAHYDAAVHKVDAAIGRLLERLRENGQLEHTVVIVTSDHGESFGEHGYLQHGPRVDEPVMRVPLIVWLPPGHPERRPGIRADAQVRTIDLLPTALDTLGFALPQDIDGVSLLPALQGQPLPELLAYGESGRSFMGVDSDRHLPNVQGKHRMLRTGDWKLVHVPRPEGAELRLYDLVRDPGELADVAEAHPEVVDRLREELNQLLALEQDLGDTPGLSLEELEMLRELGYAQ